MTGIIVGLLLIGFAPAREMVVGIVPWVAVYRLGAIGPRGPIVMGPLPGRHRPCRACRAGPGPAVAHTLAAPKESKRRAEARRALEPSGVRR